jgi:hypothetical protein
MIGARECCRAAAGSACGVSTMLFRWHIGRRKTPRLAMSLIVRDELEFIADNIRFHAAQGVDNFIVRGAELMRGIHWRDKPVIKPFGLMKFAL